MTNNEMRDVVKALNVELFKMNYKAGVRLPNLEAFLAGDDDAFAYDPKAKKGTHVSSKQEAAVIMAYLRSKSSAKRVKASVGSKTRSSGRGANH